MFNIDFSNIELCLTKKSNLSKKMKSISIGPNKGHICYRF